MRFRVLGPVGVEISGAEAAVGGARQRAVLAGLLLHANQYVTRRALVDEVWRDPPDSAAANLRTYLSRLRAVLRDPAEAESRLSMGDGGVRLRVEPGELDLDEFERLCREAEEAAERADAAVAERRYRAALELWRGDPLADVAADTPLADAAVGLAERRTRARHRCLEAMLASGRHAEALGELQEAVAAEPSHESVVAMLMLALYRCGHRDEALALFRDTRDQLDAALAIAPGAALEELHRRMLAGDPGLDAPDSWPSRPRRGDERPARLPDDPAGFVGREAELAAIAASGPVIAIDGMAGVGKTALAVRAARSAAESFPDGQIFVDLCGYAEDAPPMTADRALRLLLSAAGAEPAWSDSVDDNAAAWRTLLAQRRMVVVLDNAVDAAQVRPLLPGAAGCLTLVTSRRMLDLDAARPLSIDVLSAPEAAEALIATAGPARFAHRDAATVSAIVERCGRLPLAVGLAAGRLRSRPEWTLETLRDRLDDPERLWTELDGDDRGVAASFAMSYRELADGDRRLFRRLALHPGTDVDAYAAAALAGSSAVDDVEDVLEGLSDAHLLNSLGNGVYRFHDLIRQYAARLARREDSAAAREAAERRLFETYWGAVYVGEGLIEPGVGRTQAVPPEAVTPLPPMPDVTAANAWHRREFPNLIAVAALAAARGWDEVVWRFVYLACVNDNRYGPAEQQRLVHTGLESARRLGDVRAENNMLQLLASGYKDMDRFADALEVQRRVVDNARGLRQPGHLASALNNLANVYSAIGEITQAIATYEEAAHQAELGNLPWIRALALTNRAQRLITRGELDGVIEGLQRALAVFRDMNDAGEMARVLHVMGSAHRARSEHALALECQREALRHCQQVGDYVGIAFTAAGLGAALRGLGRYEEAVARHEMIVDLGIEHKSVLLEGGGHNELGKDYLAAGAPERALGHLRRALELVDTIGNADEQVNAHRGLADALEATGNPHQARVHLRALAELYERMDLPEAEEIRRRLR